MVINRIMSAWSLDKLNLIGSMICIHQKQMIIIIIIRLINRNRVNEIFHIYVIIAYSYKCMNNIQIQIDEWKIKVENNVYSFYRYIDIRIDDSCMLCSSSESMLIYRISKCGTTYVLL